MDVTIEKKLQDLWKVQQIDSRIDAIRAVMGELPMEVADLEDEIAGLQTRVDHIQGEMSELKSCKILIMIIQQLGLRDVY